MKRFISIFLVLSLTVTFWVSSVSAADGPSLWSDLLPPAGTFVVNGTSGVYDTPYFSATGTSISVNWQVSALYYGFRLIFRSDTKPSSVTLYGQPMTFQYSINSVTHVYSYTSSGRSQAGIELSFKFASSGSHYVNLQHCYCATGRSEACPGWVYKGNTRLGNFNTALSPSSSSAYTYEACQINALARDIRVDAEYVVFYGYTSSLEGSPPSFNCYHYEDSTGETFPLTIVSSEVAQVGGSSLIDGVTPSGARVVLYEFQVVADLSSIPVSSNSTTDAQLEFGGYFYPGVASLSVSASYYTAPVKSSWFSSLIASLKSFFADLKASIVALGDKISQALNPPADTSGASSAVSDSQQIDDFESGHQSAIVDNKATLDPSAGLLSVAPALAFVASYVTSIFNQLGIYQTVITLPLVIGLILFLCSRVPGIMRASRPPKSAQSNSTKGNVSAPDKGVDS